MQYMGKKSLKEPIIGDLVMIIDSVHTSNIPNNTAKHKRKQLILIYEDR